MTAVVLVADGGEGAGLGHVARCTGIAAALRARGGAATCRALGASGPLSLDGVRWEPVASLDGVQGDVVVLDSYRAAAGEVTALAGRCALAVLHDEGDPPPGARLVIAVGEAGGAGPGGPAGDDPAGDAPAILSGLRFACLRAPFWGLPRRVVRPAVERVLVAAGGGVLGEAAVATAAAVRAALPGAAVVLLRGPLGRFEAPDGVELLAAPPSLADELLAADLVVSAAGQTALEAAATGAPCVALPLVPNQRGNAGALAAAGAARVCGVEDVAAEVVGLARDRGERERLAAAAQAAVDGHGALRVAFRLQRVHPTP